MEAGKAKAEALHPEASISVSDGAVLQRAEEALEPLHLSPKPFEKLCIAWQTWQVLRMEKEVLSELLGSTVLEAPRFLLMAQGPQLGKAARRQKGHIRD